MINLKAIILGFIADIAATFIFSVALGILTATVLSVKGYQGSALEDEMMRFITGPVYIAVSVVIGMMFTWMGGYIAGRISKKGEYFHAGAVGGLGVLLSLPSIGQQSLWLALAGLLLPIPVAILGGDAAQKYNRANISTGLKEDNQDN